MTDPSPPKKRTKTKTADKKAKVASPNAVEATPSVSGDVAAVAATASFCPALRKCVDKWGLLPPFAQTDNNDEWLQYYAERSALEFRHSHYFGPNGKEPKKFQKCYGYGQECRNADIVRGEDGEPDRCSGCNKVSVKNSKLKYIVETTDDVNKAWSKLVSDDECLRAVYGDKFSARPPLMGPHCTESYATDCHPSGTAKGEYDDFIDRIRERIVETVNTTTVDNAEELANRTASGLYVISYYANFEECDATADVRTVEFGTRLYSPTGNGCSVDLHWYRHYRQRMTIAPEKYSNLYAIDRYLGSCNAMTPSHTDLDWRREDEDRALAILDGDTNEDRVSKTFATLPQLKEMRGIIFGNDGAVSEKISTRKVFGLLARAAGAHVVRNEGGWVYAGMRKRYELYPGEESDGEEDGNEDGPGGCVVC
mmetsp:Transcript_371/g.869  ORF Transcript_371/g.869 Transcript_371/m.869 type:complete len:424 (-) Transcript_371:170-1441(-)|eukprot:CAMPEP_0178572598 /NCGR_PEP_ID=MMETSP0697-20121206/18306_1 /TAXON_ID=265572 /ORGANISM="Extubocellulus spinifer, Strain CCMP396" /LENGTH=423 /DNA_ID=CAMNT_0020207333 /DNA_START=44 /DNA_END=1315 /DNA_ORIENTATION=+